MLYVLQKVFRLYSMILFIIHFLLFIGLAVASFPVFPKGEKPLVFVLVKVFVYKL